MHIHGRNGFRLGMAGVCVALLVCAARSAAQEAGDIPKRVRVATREVPPFAMKGEDGTWHGLSIELLREIKADLDRDAGTETELEFLELGLEEMLAAVEQGDADIAAGALTVNYERERRMDFSHPFHSSGLGIAVQGGEVRGWGGVVSAMLSWTMVRILAGLLAVLLVSGVAVYFFERKRNPDFGGGVMKGVASGIWWAAVTMTTVGYGDKVPKSAGGRLIAAIWMFSGLFLIASFTATVTSALTVTQLQSRIAGPADLARVRVGTVTASTSEKYLRGRHVFSSKYEGVEAALAALEKGRIDAVVYDAPILRYEIQRQYGDSLYVLAGTFERQEYAFALPTESPLRERINLVMLRHLGSPEWRDVLAGYLGDLYQ